MAPEPGMPARVWLDASMTQCGLAMTRSLGDHLLEDAGVVPTPEMTRYDVAANDKFFILATDGLWEFVSSQEAVDLVVAELAAGETADGASRALIQLAAMRWKANEGDYRDDTTVIVAML